MHGLRALRDTLHQDKELNINNCSIAIVGKDHAFETVNGEELQKWLDMLNVSDVGNAPAASDNASPMDTE